MGACCTNVKVKKVHVKKFDIGDQNPIFEKKDFVK